MTEKIDADDVVRQLVRHPFQRPRGSYARIVHDRVDLAATTRHDLSKGFEGNRLKMADNTTPRLHAPRWSHW